MSDPARALADVLDEMDWRIVSQVTGDVIDPYKLAKLAGWRITSAPDPIAASLAEGAVGASADDPASAPREDRSADALALAQAGRDELIDELMAHREVDDNGCWLWTGACDTKNGYGMANLGVGRPVRVHRLAYRLFVGDPQGWVLHKCDTPPCFNPTHLYDGTPQENSRDALERKSFPRGERNGAAKLTEDQAAEVRRLYGLGVGPRELAERFGVHRQTIRLVIRGETWTR